MKKKQHTIYVSKQLARWTRECEEAMIVCPSKPILLLQLFSDVIWRMVQFPVEDI